ncbi:armadillo-like helical domain-containing protein 4 isoform X3 [Takifugu flavidus]|uniref:armadillo-like helical domain-containing protein 4 isoform X3 n=1 Tax=Takifugu flavidus TaxID=433684 RepID=UPI002544841D|nr:armadillo-like helical domain-containing protein 4 isoform X3 [Takifugu flavidus]
MMLFKTLRPLLLTGICLCVCGTPVHHSQDGNCSGECVGSLETKHLRSGHSGVSGLLWKVGAGGEAAPHETPTGAAVVTQRENGDGHGGRSGSSVAGGEAWNNRSEIKKMNITKRESRDQGDAKDKEHKPDRTDHHPSSIPPLDFATPRTSTPFWDHYGPTGSSQPDPLLPDIGANLMPRDDGPQSVWTEATRASEADMVVPLSPDEAMEGTMSSEALPLIFEPLEDAVLERAPPDTASAVTLAPGNLHPPFPADSEGPSSSPTSPLPDWTPPWQTSGRQQLEPTTFPSTSVSPQPAGGASKMPKLEANLSTRGSTFSSDQHAVTALTVTTHQHKSRSGLEAMESDEDPDEEDENSEESLEDKSEEDATATPDSSSMGPAICMFPLPSVCVQRNQGLMRSWLELIREKAGYVSGMLAPVGISISGALLIVGVLYGIRTIHRKRRNNLKHQRTKTRQQQTGETGSSSQDQAMLLADSSEDEF